MRTITIVGLLCGILGVAACGGGDKPPETPPSASSSSGGSTSSTGGTSPTDTTSSSGASGTAPTSSSGGTASSSSSSSSSGSSTSSSSGGSTPPAAAPEPKDFNEQVAAGEQLYGNHCASCHGGKGEGGGKSPKLAGAGALPVDPPKDAKTRKGKFTNAKDIFDFVSKQMPPGQGGSLKDHEYWSIIAWDLKANGVTSKDKLDGTSGAKVTLKKK